MPRTARAGWYLRSALEMGWVPSVRAERCASLPPNNACMPLSPADGHPCSCMGLCLPTQVPPPSTQRGGGAASSHRFARGT